MAIIYADADDIGKQLRYATSPKFGAEAGAFASARRRGPLAGEFRLSVTSGSRDSAGPRRGTPGSVRPRGSRRRASREETKASTPPRSGLPPLCDADSVKIAANAGPMHGVQPTPKTKPSGSAPSTPRSMASSVMRTSRRRMSNGRRPVIARPRTVTNAPIAICHGRWDNVALTAPPTSPSSVNGTAKPSVKSNPPASTRPLPLPEPFGSPHPRDRSCTPGSLARVEQLTAKRMKQLTQ